MNTAAVQTKQEVELKPNKIKSALHWQRFLGNPAAHVAGLLCLLGYLFWQSLEAQRALAGTIGFAMDDAWIHVAVARNFADGLGWGVVPGKMLSVSTSPTWTLLLSAFFLVFENPLKITYVLSLGCMAVAAICFYQLAFLLTERRLFAFAAAVLVLLDPIAVWGLASGLELPLALASLSMVLVAYYAAGPASKVRRYVVPLLLVFAGVSRPELFVLIPLAIADTWWALRRSPSLLDRAQAWRTGFVQSVLVLLALAPYFVFNVLSHGKIFPATYYAKTIVRGVGLSAALADGSWQALKRAFYLDPLVQVYQVIDVLQKYQVLVLLLMIPGVIAFCRPFSSRAAARGFLLPLALVVLPWTMGMSSPSRHMANHADRYFVIFPPLAIMMACMSLRVMSELKELRYASYVLLLLMTIFPLRHLEATLRHVGVDAESTQRLYVDMPIWLAENLDPKAKLAVNDIGGIAYYAPRDLIDVMGLASPEVWPAIQREYGKPLDVSRLRDFLREKGIQYIILSPRYYPEMTKDTKTFVPLRQWAEKYEHGRTISPQVLYQVNW